MLVALNPKGMVVAVKAGLMGALRKGDVAIFRFSDERLRAKFQKVASGTDGMT